MLLPERRLLAAARESNVSGHGLRRTVKDQQRGRATERMRRSTAKKEFAPLPVQPLESCQGPASVEITANHSFQAPYRFASPFILLRSICHTKNRGQINRSSRVKPALRLETLRASGNWSPIIATATPNTSLARSKNALAAF